MTFVRGLERKKERGGRNDEPRSVELSIIWKEASRNVVIMKRRRFRAGKRFERLSVRYRRSNVHRRND